MSFINSSLSDVGTVVVSPGLQANDNNTIAALEVSGTFGSVVGTWQGSVDGVNFKNIAVLRLDTGIIEQTPTLTDNTTAQWKADITGFQKVQFNLTSIGSGTIAVSIMTAAGSLPNYLLQANSRVFVGQVVVNGAGTGAAFKVGPNGSTNPTFFVSTHNAGNTVATGFTLTGAAAGGGVALAAISSGTNESVLIDGKGSGLVTIASISTGGVSFVGSTVIAGTLTAGGTLANSVQVGTNGPLVYSGSGAPSINAAVKGSLYLRTDGSSTSTRAFIATDTAGTWTALTTAA